MKAPTASLYEILGVDSLAKPHILRNAYRRLARTHHPDVCPDPLAHELMAQINSAFETLIDPVRRMEYDSSLNGGVVLDPTPDARQSRNPDAVRVRIKHRLRNHRTPIYSIAFERRSGSMLSSSFDNELIWWDPWTGLVQRRLKLEGGVVSTVQPLGPDEAVVAGCSESVLSVWRIEGDSPQVSSQPLDWACCVRLAPSGKRVLTGSVNRLVRVSNLETGLEEVATTEHGESVTSVAWSSDGRLFVTGSADATAKLWRAADGVHLHTFTNVRSTVSALCFSPDSKYLAVAAVDLSIRIFRLSDYHLVKTFFGHEKPIEALAFHPASWLLASAGRDGCVGIFDVASGLGHGKIEASHLPLATIAFSPDGRLLAAGGLDKVLRVWDLSLRT